MGKKSGAKKKKQQSKVQQQEVKKESILKKFFSSLHSSKTEEKTPPVLEKKDSSKKFQKVKKIVKEINRKALFGGVLTIIMLVILVSVGYLLFQKAFRAQPIAKLLPEDDVILVLEINTNFDHNQLLKTFGLLKNHPQYSKEKLIEKIENQFIVDYESDLKSWFGRAAGVVVLNSRKDKEKLNIAYFAEVISQEKLDEFLIRRNAKKEDYKNFSMYEMDGPVYMTLVENYVFVSKGKEVNYELVDSQAQTRLYESKEYRKIDNKLPLNKSAFLYMDFRKINNSFFKHFSFLGEQGLSTEILKPFLKTFTSEGIALVAMDNNFALQSFLSLDEKIAENNSYTAFENKYSADLTAYMPENVLLFWGAENLEFQLNKILHILSGGDEAVSKIFISILENYTKKYFGNDISFSSEVLPLLQNEFAFVIEKNKEGKNIYKAIIELKDKQKDTISLHQIASNFTSIGAIFKPKVVERKLEDGTVGKEIIAIPEEIVKSESIYGDTAIYELKIGNQNWGIYYTIIDDVAVIANNFDGVASSIDIVQKKKTSLKVSQIFATVIEPVLKSSDEVSYINTEKLIPTIFKDKKIPEVLNLIGFLSSGRNYFDDGIVTINYIHIK
ncbi:hypothetical protein A3B60_01290 [Candidatus Peregrinibacteria bacterium RIFCSPLOWO2_01_FULL_39_12]|nr:MAG: hypothetical protein A3B60_01290 [Candidatus Peregrinibacteria bacterium RIFCSPLOWO2_01_FULL_39_12]OGJ43201.1 MAG: hypothetical protein A3I58_00305 [Candidatus Peregrinibacteria bacterium RIFCSPLOWO2_02_FULL_39_10]